MTTAARTASDSSYHSRHSRRTLRRAERIAKHIKEPGHILDVGCNNGITSQYLLDSGKAKHVTGIELHATTVDQSLRDSPNFDLIEGNVVDIELDRTFDNIVYGAVHHHILNFHGMSTAIATLQKLASHCGHHLFFETGQIGEGGRWAWQRAMRRHFRTDEEHFFYLLRAIEHLIDGFEVIGTFWIHGIRRQYLRIDIRQDDKAEDASARRVPWPDNAQGPYVRSWGSRDQALSLESETRSDESPTRFWTADTDGGSVFIKKHCHLPVATQVEWNIGRQVHADWAVRPVALTEPGNALVFPLLPDAIAISRRAAAPAAERRKLAAAVLEMHADATDTNIELPSSLLLDAAPGRKLIQLVDLNPNNLVVMRENGRDVLRVVDFEQQSGSYASRNRMHLARVLWRLGHYRSRAILSYLRGWVGTAWALIRGQASTFGERVAARQPSMGSLLVAEFRSATGRALGRLLALVGLE